MAIETVDFRKECNKCSECPLQQACTFVPVEVSTKAETVDILFVGSSPDQEDTHSGRPFMGKAGQILREAISQSLNKVYFTYALTNVVSCHPEDNRSTSSEEAERCKSHVEQCIKSYKPKMVILLGGTPAQALLPQDYIKKLTVTKLTKIFPFTDLLSKTLYGVNFNPSYVARNGGVSGELFAPFLTRLNFLTQQVQLSENEQAYINHPFKIVPVTQLAEVLADFEEYNTIGFDYESSDNKPWNANHRMTGFSFAVIIPDEKGEPSPKGTFVSFPHDYQFTQTERDIFVDFLKRKKPWTYNAKFEMAVSWRFFDKFIKLNDSMVLCTINCRPTNLKDNARHFLGITHEWEAEVVTITSSYLKIRDLRSKLEKSSPDLCQFLYVDFKEFCKHVRDSTVLMPNKKFKLVKPKLYVYTKEIATALSTLTNFLTDEEIQAGIVSLTQGFTEWELVPPRYLGPYCCWDSYYTALLHDELWENAQNSYDNYLCQTWLACVLEAYSQTWSDSVADELDDLYLGEAIGCLGKLIPLLDLPDEDKLTAMEIEGRDVPKIKKLDDLKKIFNPNSNKYEKQLPFWDAYQNDEILNMVTIYHLSTGLKNCYFIPELDASRLIDKTSSNISVDNIVQYIKTVVEPRVKKFEAILAAIDRRDERERLTESEERLRKRAQKTVDEKRVENLYQMIEDILHIWDFYFKRFATEIIEFQYKAYTKIGSVKIDDKTTWTPEFWMLYYLKLFKKVSKSRSTYIQGKVGRGVVNFCKVTDPSKPPVRLLNYEDAIAKYTVEERQEMIKKDYSFILNGSYRENSAECLTGETEIIILNQGSRKTVTLSEIYSNFLSKKYYTYSIKDNKQVTRQIQDIILSDQVKELIELEFENGKRVRCTPNHRWLLATGEYKEAQNLTYEDELWEVVLD